MAAPTDTHSHFLAVSAASMQGREWAVIDSALRAAPTDTHSHFSAVSAASMQNESGGGGI